MGEFWQKLENKMKDHEMNTWFMFYDKSNNVERFSIYARDYWWQDVGDAVCIFDSYSYREFMEWLNKD